MRFQVIKVLNKIQLASDLHPLMRVSNNVPIFQRGLILTNPVEDARESSA